MISDEAGFSVLSVDGKLESVAMIISFPGNTSDDDDPSSEAEGDSEEVLHLRLGQKKELLCSRGCSFFLPFPLLRTNHGSNNRTGVVTEI